MGIAWVGGEDCGYVERRHCWLRTIRRSEARGWRTDGWMAVSVALRA